MQEQDAPETVKIMFVCLGNICRSPLAEGVFREQVRRAGLEDRFEVTSSGTGSWHVGQPPDGRMQQTARGRGLDISDQCAQQFDAEHLEAYDHIFVMDKSNLHDVLFFDDGDAHGGKVRLFREFDPQPDDYQVPDPYQGGREGFEHVYEIVERTARRMLDALVDEYDLDGEKRRADL